VHVLYCQYVAYSFEELIQKFEEADWVDCKINAYNWLGDKLGYASGTPSVVLRRSAVETAISAPLSLDRADVARRIQLKSFAEQAPVVIFIDLDDKKRLRYVRKKIKEVFLDDDLEPTVIDSGNGYHMVLPIEIDPAKFPTPIPATMLGKKDGLIPGRDIRHAYLFTQNQNTYSNTFSLSANNELLRFAEDFLTSNKADSGHNPSVRSCMIRAPGSNNSKLIKRGVTTFEAKIVNRWNGQRKAHIIYLLSRFNFHIREEKERRIRMMAQARNRRIMQSRNDEAFSRGVVVRGGASTSNSIANNYHYWYIELLLQIAIPDHRKRAVSVLLAPYFMRIKQLPFEEAERRILDWLARCDAVRPLSFDARDKTNAALIFAKEKNYLPLEFINLPRKFDNKLQAQLSQMRSTTMITDN
jgi:hypothetical protein